MTQRRRRGSGEPTVQRQVGFGDIVIEDPELKAWWLERIHEFLKIGEDMATPRARRKEVKGELVGAASTELVDEDGLRAMGTIHVDEYTIELTKREGGQTIANRSEGVDSRIGARRRTRRRRGGTPAAAENETSHD